MGTWLNPIDRSITTKYRIGCTKFSILSLITLSKLQHFFAKFFKKQFPQRKYKVTYRICCYFFCCVPSSFYSWKFVLKQYFYNMILQQLRTTSGPAECVCHSRVCILCNLENEVRNTFTNYDKNDNNYKNRVKTASINQKSAI